MKYILPFLLIICVYSSKLDAQGRLSLGVKGGIGIPGLQINSGNPVIDGYKTTLSPYCGIVLETGLSKKWSLLNEVNYATISIIKNGGQVIPKSVYPIGITSSDHLYADFYTKIRIHYIEIPYMLKYYMYEADRFNFFVNGGIFAGILIRSKINISAPGLVKIYTDAAHTNALFNGLKLNLTQEKDLSDRLTPLNFGVQAGFGMTLKNSFGEFFFTAGSNFGLVDIQENKGDGQNKTKAATLALGYLVHIYK
ncbi:porin family protein [Parasediminibacterium sp. JCM 36343]|uniref:porin family protein n=1 Tax=Parasediminibacterium sp. JCM 36343 TaxID=3374279 RepID=UPI00397A53D0